MIPVCIDLDNPSTPSYIFPAMDAAMYLHRLKADQVRIVTVIRRQPGNNLALPVGAAWLMRC
jgi:hypothetical protein